jgi:hypothetical protein
VQRHLFGIGFIEYPLENAIVNGTNLPTSVSEKPSNESIHTFELAQNYPNPFMLKTMSGSGTSTVIRYRLQKDAPVKLTIYDMLGREIKQLVNRREPPGDQTAVWDGTNSHDEKVPSGIYFYRIQVGKLSEVRKLILMRR